MKGDFTRDTFDPAKHFSRVLMQQGRVTLDADPNEQTEILLRYMRLLAMDLIGPHAAPAVGGGFNLSSVDGQLVISGGRYYVDGILVENEADCAYTSQPDYPLIEDDLILTEMSEPTGKSYWLYLDVWERHITHLEDTRIREVALGGPDTCTRSKVIWQVKALEAAASPKPMPAPEPAPVNESELARLKEAIESAAKKAKSIQEEIDRTTDPAKRKELEENLTILKTEMLALEKNLTELAGQPTAQPVPEVEPAEVELSCDKPLEGLVRLSDAALAARVDPGFHSDDPCILVTDAKYRGTENHLYRVEIHKGSTGGAATFKWSRDNGSVATLWLGSNGFDLTVASGRGFSAGCWIELIDDSMELLGMPGYLVKVAKVEGQTITVDPSSVPSGLSLVLSEMFVHPKMRRWDQVEIGDIVLQEGAVPVRESTSSELNWMDLEDGIQVRFAKGGEYRTGDYWLIPARVSTGGIEWPESAGAAVELTPFGIQHHYAPLGFVTWKNKQWQIAPCSCVFSPIAECGIKEEEAAAAGDALPPGTLNPKPKPRPTLPPRPKPILTPRPASPRPVVTGMRPAGGLTVNTNPVGAKGVSTIPVKPKRKRKDG